SSAPDEHRGPVLRDGEAMTDHPTDMYVPARPPVDAGKLWAGGLATAAVAALVTVVGVLVARGLIGVSLLAPKGEGVWGDASTGWYAVGAAVAALLATGVMHLLLLVTPRPLRFFGWLVTLATAAAVVAPFVTSAGL